MEKILFLFHRNVFEKGARLEFRNNSKRKFRASGVLTWGAGGFHPTKKKKILNTRLENESNVKFTVLLRLFLKRTVMEKKEN